MDRSISPAVEHCGVKEQSSKMALSEKDDFFSCNRRLWERRYHFFEVWRGWVVTFWNMILCRIIHESCYFFDALSLYSDSYAHIAPFIKSFLHTKELLLSHSFIHSLSSSCDKSCQWIDIIVGKWDRGRKGGGGGICGCVGLEDLVGD